MMPQIVEGMAEHISRGLYVDAHKMPRFFQRFAVAAAIRRSRAFRSQNGRSVGLSRKGVAVGSDCRAFFAPGAAPADQRECFARNVEQRSEPPAPARVRALDNGAT